MIRQYHLPLPRREAMTADDFMVTDSNREAVAWILERDPAAWPSPALILHGPKGCGKTHLLTIWQEKTGARRLNLGEDIVPLILNGTAGPALALDDADRIAGDTAHEEWMQHLYNAARSVGVPLLLTAAQAPASWGLGLKDIESRLKSCLAAAIDEPDDDLMRAMLLKQFNDRQLLVETDVIEYLAQRMDRSGTAIREMVERLDQASLEQRRRITVPFVQGVLAAGQAFQGIGTP